MARHKMPQRTKRRLIAAAIAAVTLIGTGVVIGVTGNAFARNRPPDLSVLDCIPDVTNPSSSQPPPTQSAPPQESSTAPADPSDTAPPQETAPPQDSSSAPAEPAPAEPAPAEPAPAEPAPAQPAYSHQGHAVQPAA